MLSAIASGFLLGLSCGLAPGPLMTLVLAQTLRYGRREGFKIAFAPLLTDAPIILVALALAERAAHFDRVLGALGVAGGLFVLYLAADTLRPPRLDAEAPDVQPGSWSKGLWTNMLNPHPWLFWMTVGAAILARAMAVNWGTAAAFLSTFYLLLVGSKVMLAMAADRSRAFVTGRLYEVTMRGLGVLLLGFGLLLMLEGGRYLGLI